MTILNSKRGFTLIELMIVLSIMAVLGTVGVAGFRNYSQIQVLQSSVNEFTTALNTARSRALSQVKPAICASSSTLDGYGVKVLANSYRIFVRCSESDKANDSIGKEIILSKNISFADADNNKIFFFPTLTGGVSTPEQVTISGYGKGKIVSINSLGGIAAMLPPPTPTPTPTPTPSPTPIPTKKVFVTSAKYNGNLEGLSGADSKCQSLASGADLLGTYKAWLSDTSTSAVSRLSHSSLSYILTNGDSIADNWDDLIDGTLKSSIRYNEFGTEVTVGDDLTVFTSTRIDGVSSGSSNCNDWNSSSSDYSGYVGSAAYSSSAWTYFDTTLPCFFSVRLYCIEQ